MLKAERRNNKPQVAQMAKIITTKNWKMWSPSFNACCKNL